MRQNSNVAVAKSPFTGSEQVHAHQGQWWDADISVTPSEAANARPITAWFASLNGREKTVLFGDPAAATARGSASTTPGTPLVNGASQTGGSLICDGGPNAATGYLLEGDYIQVDTGSASRLHMVLEDVNTDGSGDFTATIWPNIRTSPTENAAITVSSPKGVFRLTENMRSWDESTVIWGFSFGLTEVI
tara:strand:+ start:1008 stop:1577 length:570 start_codon:yes stop_codon:yes gene_type:complete